MRAASSVVIAVLGAIVMFGSPTSSRADNSGTVSCKPAEYSVLARFLADSTPQYEDAEQLATIRQALLDLADEDWKVVATKRYPDYAMNQGKWTVFEVLSGYFSSSHSTSLSKDPEMQKRFLIGASCPEGKSALRSYVAERLG